MRTSLKVKLLAGVAACVLTASDGFAPLAAYAQGAPILLPEVEVIATTPVPGGEIAREKVPAANHVLSGEELRPNEVASVTDALESRIGGISLNQAQGNPFQPNLSYRGFEASPLAGNPQGLAVYVNGARFNQPFGDTVNWDLIPSIAIHRMVLEGSNPAFGLNALGGSLSVELKNGFNYQGAEVEVLGGSFGRITGSLQYGRQIDNVGVYVAMTGLKENGWRQFSPSQLGQFYGDIGWRGSRGEVHFNVIGASNSLVGNGTSPVELLAADRTAVFTHPDQTRNNYARLQLSGTFELTDTWSLQGNAYYSRLSQRTRNGDATEAAPCAADLTILCLEADGPQLRDRNGNPIPNFNTASSYLLFPDFAARFADGGPYAMLNRTATDTDGYGATLQATNKTEVFGRPNRFIAGASFDGGSTRFAASTEIGALTLDRGFAGTGIIIDQPDGSITPVDVKTQNAYYGLYFSDVLDVTDRLSLTAAGRFNLAQINLRDRIGTALNGDHTFSRFNPAAGLAFKLTPEVSLYAGYSEANRAPTPAELSCADPAAPCSLTNFFVGDPPLNQVVARTVEAGLRGRFTPFEGATLRWNAGVFRTATEDDIMFVSSPIVGRAFFQNIGATRRQGIEAGAGIRTARWNAFVDYAFLDATFQSALTLNSPENPFADADGRIFVTPGNVLPGVPAHALKFGASYMVTDAWKVGFTGRAVSGKFLVGDESNLNARTDPYVVVNINTSYAVSPNVTVFGVVENLFNAKYASFGTFSPTSSIPILEAPGATDTRSLSPGAPLAFYGGLRVKLN
jgi:iron complex outermembrane recepter protein